MLESASNAFHRAHLAVSAAARLLRNDAATGRDEREALAELDRRLDELWSEENRLAVRLGLSIRSLRRSLPVSWSSKKRAGSSMKLERMAATLTRQGASRNSPLRYNTNSGFAPRNT